MKPIILTIALITNVLQFEVAMTPAEKEKGMMNRQNWGRIDGMVFINEQPQMSAYWMKNTSLPMTLFYMNSDLQIMEEYAMKPYSLEPVYSESQSVAYVLEVKPELSGLIRENEEALNIKLKPKLEALRKKQPPRH